MKAVTAHEMRRIDRASILELGIPAELLMGLAGKAAAETVMKEFPGAERVLVICGTGNNGGDGFYAAYLLRNRGITTDIEIFGDPLKITGPGHLYKNIFEKTGGAISVYSGGGLEGYSLIVDAVFGTGYRVQRSAPFERLVDEINSSGTPVLSVDLPSGLPSEGPVQGISAVRASVTVTIGLPKLSLVTAPGIFYAGKLITADIGFPTELTEDPSLKRSLIDKDYVSSLNLTGPHDPGAHKYRRGSVLIGGGSPGMEGAVLLAAAAALNTGTGLVTILTHPEARASIAGKISEVMTAVLPGPAPGGDGGLKDMGLYLERFFSEKRYTCVAAGPGLGRGLESENFLRALVSALSGHTSIKLILDADALFFVPAMKEDLAGFGPERLLLTPHAGEAARLASITAAVVDADRINVCESLAAEYGCGVLLKGPGTVISSGSGTLINTTGGPLLAAAGSGDLLSGIIAALAGRLSLIEAAAAGTYIHGLAGDLLAAEGRVFTRAGELADNISRAFAAAVKLSGDRF